MLNLEQIQKIDLFFEENGLELYDLRMELVDHVSEAIEYSMKVHAGKSFEQAFEEETGKFDKKELKVKNYEALQQSGDLKEWRYFTARKIGRALFIYLLLIMPVAFLNYRLLVHAEILYLLAGTCWYLGLLMRFRRKYKESRKQLGLYFNESLGTYLFPVLYFVFLVLKPLVKGVEPVEGKAEWVFILFVFLELFVMMALLAKMDARKRQYSAAKKAYPLLFEN